VTDDGIDFVELLADLVAPPAARPPGVRWTEVERVLTTPPPGDYQRIVELYGPGAFDEFLWVLQPMPHPHLGLVENHEVIRRLGMADPNRIDWAMTGNADQIAWRIDSSPPDTWPVSVLDSVSEGWVDFAMGAAEFLYKVLGGEIAVGLFAPDFPSARPTFEPLRLDPS